VGQQLKLPKESKLNVICIKQCLFHMMKEDDNFVLNNITH